uniref:Secreted protein n=1 Tax=Arundo donax TaxID=35708 RepID=A0A0A9DCF4_ARUDO
MNFYWQWFTCCLILTSFPLRRLYSQVLASATFRRCSSSPSRKKLRVWWSRPRVRNSGTYSQRRSPFIRFQRNKASVFPLRLISTCAYLQMFIVVCVHWRIHGVSLVVLTIWDFLSCISHEPV